MSLISWLMGATNGADPVQTGAVEASAFVDAGWWGGAFDSVAGVAVGPETALKLSTVWACVGLLSDTIAALPLVIYESTADGKRRATNHPLYAVLHDQPNEKQTAFEFWQMMMTHALLRGNGYAQIVPGPRGFADQLVPIHPDFVTVEKLRNGRLRYHVGGGEQQPLTLLPEEMFHLRGMTLTGDVGVSVIGYARDSMGLSLAAERYGGRLFRNDARPGGVLRTDKKLTPDAAKRLKIAWESAHLGGNQHRVAVLEEGLEWQAVGIPPDEAQFLQTREFQAEDICRWFRVPPHMVGLTSKATSWGSGIEQMSIGFVTYTLMSWLSRISQAIRRDLILAKDRYFAEHVVEGLLRGNITDRYAAYATGVQWGWLSPNEIRRLENMNDREGGDEYLRPMNMTTGNEATTPEATSHYLLLAQESAGRLVRKERAAVTRAIEKGGDWADVVTDFYNSHQELVGQTMRVSPLVAGAYCRGQCDAVLAAEGWPEGDEAMVTRLVEIALSPARSQGERG